MFDVFAIFYIFSMAHNTRVGKMDFKVGGSWNTEKYCRPPWLVNRKIFLISRRSKIDKTVTSWPWWQPFNSFFFKTLSFFPFFLFAIQKFGEHAPQLPRSRRSWIWLPILFRSLSFIDNVASHSKLVRFLFEVYFESHHHKNQQFHLINSSFTDWHKLLT